MKAKGRCPMCGGVRQYGKTMFSVDLGFGVVVVRDVPAKICAQCGNEWIDAKTSKKLEKIVEAARKKKLQIEMLQFRMAA